MSCALDINEGTTPVMYEIVIHVIVNLIREFEPKLPDLMIFTFFKFIIVLHNRNFQCYY